jgi:hypothetical protein
MSLILFFDGSGVASSRCAFRRFRDFQNDTPNAFLKRCGCDAGCRRFRRRLASLKRSFATFDSTSRHSYDHLVRYRSGGGSAEARASRYLQHFRSDESSWDVERPSLQKSRCDATQFAATIDRFAKTSGISAEQAKATLETYFQTFSGAIVRLES